MVDATSPTPKPKTQEHHANFIQENQYFTTSKKAGSAVEKLCTIGMNSKKLKDAALVHIQMRLKQLNFGNRALSIMQSRESKEKKWQRLRLQQISIRNRKRKIKEQRRLQQW